jgi:uncharacterized protein involved in outer membrane biogenesis
MRRRLRLPAIGLAVCAALVGGAALYVHFYGLNWARGPLSRVLGAKLGRPVRIAGDLEVALGTRPRIAAHGVRVDNAPWAGPRPLFTAEAVALRFHLWPLLRGRWLFESTEFEGARLSLIRNEAGDVNWRDDRPRRATRPVLFSLPRDIVLLDSRVTYTDRTSGRTLDFEFDRLRARGAEGADYAVRGRGRYNGHALEVSGLLGPWEVFWNDQPYPVRLDFAAGETRARLHGRFARPRELDGLDAALRLNGRSLDELWELFALPLAETPPYAVSGRFTRDGNVFGLHGFSGALGRSDLRGTLSVALRRPRRPLLRADLRTRSMDLADFRGFWGARPAAARSAAAAGPVFPDRPFSFTKLRAMDASVDFRAASVRGARLLEDARLSLQLDGGRLRLAPLDLGFAGGRLRSRAIIDARSEPAVLGGDLVLSSIDLARLMQGMTIGAKASGTIGGRARLETSGDSLRKMAEHLDGDLGFVLADGRLGETALELVAVDFGEALVAELWGDKAAPIRCLVGTFDADHGRLTARNLLLDSDDVRITGEGTVDLANERVDLTLHQHPKDFSIGTLRSPIDIEGGLRTRRASVRKSGLVRRAGAALALGTLVNPLAALLPLVELGRGEKPGACEAALADSRAIAASPAGSHSPARRPSPAARSSRR